MASSQSPTSNNNNNQQLNAADNQDANNGNLRVQGAQVDTSLLAETITFPFSGRTAKNRFLKAPMTERLCEWNPPSDLSGAQMTRRGYPSAEYTQLYRRWGEGEIGVIVAGNVMIQYDAVEAWGNPILCDDHDGRVGVFREVCQGAQRHGSLFIAQLSHPGRQGPATMNPYPVSASEVHLEISWAGNWFAPPRALRIEEIPALVRRWGEAAFWAHQAGFDGVQVHCAHGYLLAQFLSPTTNKRTDIYGGSLENRSRIIFEILAEIHRRVPDPRFIIGVKINSVEFQAGGETTSEDCRKLCQRLEDEGKVDFVDLSGGTFEGRAFEHKKESTRARESYFVEFAEMIRPLLKKTKVYVTGGFRTAGGMMRAVQDGACDGVGIGRPLGAEPYLCRELLAGRVTGALENFVPLPKNTQATGSQLHQVGRGEKKISDWSDKTEVKRWVEEFEKETERKISILPQVDSSGYPKLQAEVGFEYRR